MRGHSYRKRCVVVYKWIELVLEEWRGYVATRGQDWTRDTEEGRQEIESLAKATKTLRPLQDQLKHRVRESVMGLADQWGNPESDLCGGEIRTNPRHGDGEWEVLLSEYWRPAVADRSDDGGDPRTQRTSEDLLVVGRACDERPSGGWVHPLGEATSDLLRATPYLIINHVSELLSGIASPCELASLSVFASSLPWTFKRTHPLLVSKLSGLSYNSDELLHFGDFG